MRKHKNGIGFVDLKTLAECKSISVFTLRKYCKKNRMPHVRVGRKIIVDPIAFDEWLLKKDIESQDKKATSIKNLLDEVYDEVA